MMTLI